MPKETPWQLEGRNYILCPLWRHPSNASIKQGLEARGARVYLQEEILKELTKSLKAYADTRFEALILASAEFEEQHTWIAKLLNCPIVPELDLAQQLIPTRMIAVTGTNGKTSTTEMLAFGLNKVGENVQAIINFERSVLGLQKTLPDSVVVEACSAQLQFCKTFAPHVSLLLNLAPNHLDHHPDFKDYAKAKAKIFLNQTAKDFVIFNADCPEVVKLIKAHAKTPVKKIGFTTQIPPRGLKTAMLFKRRNHLYWREGKKEKKLCGIPAWPDLGIHFVENRLAAIAAAYVLGFNPQRFCDAITGYQLRPHRQQIINPKNKLLFVNDSKSTSPHSALRALWRFSEKKAPKPLLWLTGGTDKNLPLTDIVTQAKKSVKHIMILGSFPRLEALLKKRKIKFHQENTLTNALKKAQALCHKKGIILFSPIGAASDLFADYEDRGEQFMNAVQSLKRIR